MTLQEKLKIYRDQFEILAEIDLDHWHDLPYYKKVPWLESVIRPLYRTEFQADQRIVGSGRIRALGGLDGRLQILAVFVFDVQARVGALEGVGAVGRTVGLVHVGGPGEGFLEAFVAAAGGQQAAGEQRDAGGERQQKQERHHHRDDLADLEAGIENAVYAHGVDPLSE